MNALAGRRVLVTGAAGFLGTHLVHRLVAAGAAVCALDRPSARLWSLVRGLESVTCVLDDVRSLGEPTHDRALEGVTTVFHLAAVGVVPGSASLPDVVEGNIAGVMAALLASERLGARMVYCGSCFEYGPGERWTEHALPAPTTEYGAAKAAGWLLVNAFARRTGIEVVTLRPFTMYGPHEPPGRLVPTVVRHALAGEPIELTPGEQARDFVYVEDVADAFVAAAASADAPGGTFNVCTGVAVRVRDIVERILRLTGSTAVPRFGALPYRSTELPTLSGDPGQAGRVLGWRPHRSLEQGLRSTVDWYRSHRLAVTDPPAGAPSLGRS